MNFDVIKSNLEKRGFTVSLFDTASEASKYLNTVIDGKTVGFGGSVTLQEMGLYES
ncbi:MAG: LUD domain-containing protein, partial [Clostridia bacterium]|nr:LUD domain-containing protein [Clostridia bacterium]